MALALSFPSVSLVLGGLLIALAGCSSDDTGVTAGGAGYAGTPGVTIDPGGGGNSGIAVVPSDFVPGVFGGYKLGDPVTDSDISVPSECVNILTGVVRDFRASHPDFEDFCCSGLTGIVTDQLGDDQKPVYAAKGATADTSGPDDFNQWYRTQDDINEPFLVSLAFMPNGTTGVFTFHSDSFFPLDGAGFGNERNSHNFHFTTELHTQFTYKGNESFTFIGDDDVFVYINGHLAIDLGGVHPALTGEVVLREVADEFGLEREQTYNLDLFHAERHTTESNFRIDTTMQFTNCGYVVPDNGPK